MLSHRLRLFVFGVRVFWRACARERGWREKSVGVLRESFPLARSFEKGKKKKEKKPSRRSSMLFFASPPKCPTLLPSAYLLTSIDGVGAPLGRSRPEEEASGDSQSRNPDRGAMPRRRKKSESTNCRRQRRRQRRRRRCYCRCCICPPGADTRCPSAGSGSRHNEHRHWHCDEWGDEQLARALRFFFKFECFFLASRRQRRRPRSTLAQADGGRKKRESENQMSSREKKEGLNFESPNHHVATPLSALRDDSMISS